EAGILKGLAMLFRPIILKIFPDIPKDHPAIGYILSNITANLFGLGNAATPMGIKAMKELKTLAPDEEATRSMITFLAINTAGLTIVPTTIIAIRMQYDSIAPTELIDHPAIGYILSNITANLFGLGNAATPMGIKAMKELKTLAPDEEATRSMITFLAINTAGLTIVPTTIIAIRMQYDSIAPTEI